MKYSLIYALDSARALTSRKKRSRKGIATMEVVMIVAIVAVVIGGIFVVANQGFGAMKDLVLSLFKSKLD